MASSPLVDIISERLRNRQDQGTCELIAQLTPEDVNCAPKTFAGDSCVWPSLFMQAIHDRHSAYFYALIKVPGLDINQPSQWSKRHATPLYWTCALHQWDLAVTLLRHPDINPCQGQLSPLAPAIHNSCPEVVWRALITWPGMNLNYESSQNGDSKTLLYKAVQTKLPQVVALLLAQPTLQVNQANMHGYTALMCAAWSYHASCLRLLLAHPDIDVQAVNTYGETAASFLLDETHAGYEECCRLLKPAAFWSLRANWLVWPQQVRQQVGLSWQLTNTGIWRALPLEVIQLVLTHLTSITLAE